MQRILYRTVFKPTITHTTPSLMVFGQLRQSRRFNSQFPSAPPTNCLCEYLLTKNERKLGAGRNETTKRERLVAMETLAQIYTVYGMVVVVKVFVTCRN